jgi:hypothetical protein
VTQFASTLYPQTNPTNPILLSARGQLINDVPLDYLIHTVTDGDMIRLWHVNHNATPRHVRHARRVLTRLAALTG